MGDDWIILLVLADFLAIYWLATTLYKRVHARLAWPDPAPQPYMCPDCARMFRSQRVLGWHGSEHAEAVGPIYWQLPKRNRNILRRSRWAAAIPQLKLVK